MAETDLSGLVEPIKGGQIKKGMFALLKGKPCRVYPITFNVYIIQILSVSVSKTGKHGHAKCHFVGINIFNKKKVEGLESSTHNMNMPFVTKEDYTVVGINREGF